MLLHLYKAERKTGLDNEYSIFGHSPFDLWIVRALFPYITESSALTN
jgi:hypothetical protein